MRHLLSHDNSPSLRGDTGRVLHTPAGQENWRGAERTAATPPHPAGEEPAPSDARGNNPPGTSRSSPGWRPAPDTEHHGGGCPVPGHRTALPARRSAPVAEPGGVPAAHLGGGATPPHVLGSCAPGWGGTPRLRAPAAPPPLCGAGAAPAPLP